MARKVSISDPVTEDVREEKKKSSAVLSVKQASTICQGYIIEINRSEGITRTILWHVNPCLKQCRI